MKLEGRVALVTGGGVGIGRGIALEMAREGAGVAVVDIDPARARAGAAAVRETGAKAAAIEADVSRRADVARMVRDTVGELGGLDILVNNAGVSRGMDFLDLTDEAWDFVMDTNLKSAFMGTQEAARYWVEQGRGGVVLNISSVDDTMPYPHNAHYNASKAGLKMLTQSNALALAEHRIRVNCIGPGICETELTRHLTESPLWEEGIPVKIPWGRVGQPADIGKAAVFLASDDADFITGVTLYVDGGHIIAAHEQIMKQYRPARRDD